ncbi:glutamate-rich protein 1 isoform X2 [Tachysurus fulvidraco]|uniref:glutamate-rich protein 1 isoform X2 n=1 Tax=Tachysurus fulvidraco TaxID=1234273 RepID=UPI001FEDEC08|nr:glutamate-rich protein 1 isoform X2 [Tachysurus fulvidraco]
MRFTSESGSSQVFQAKVLQRLYPATPKVEKVPETPVHHPQATKCLKGFQLKPSKVSGHAGLSAVSGRKVYTVLPPPKDYIPASGDGLGSLSDAQAVNNADEMPVDLPGSEDRSDAEDDRASERRKRRRKKKSGTISDGNRPTAPADAADDKEDDAKERNAGKAEGSEGLSKNKRRKMKRKRHKEKLLALGLLPRSMALEFTYKKDEEDEEKKVEEVVDFLRSTRDLYFSDRSRSAGDPSVLLGATESLFARLSDNTFPPSVLSVLVRLRALLRQREVEKLHTVLQEFTRTSTLPKDETEATCTLFHYWITEVLPMQKETNAQP